MTKWYLRRIAVRDVLVACVVASGLSATLSWLIFAWIGAGAEKFPWGSLGDWAAAIGTWVIGYGAWKYAAATFLLQKQQLDQADDRLKKQRSAHLRSTETWAQLMIRPLFHLNAALRQLDPTGAVKLATVCGTIAGARNLISAIKWDDPAWDVLGDNGVEAKISALTVARNFDHVCGVFLDHYFGKEGSEKPQAISGISSVWTACQELDRAGAIIEKLAKRVKMPCESGSAQG